MCTANVSNSPNEFEIIKFLTERAHAEASLFWVRNSVFLGVSVATLGAAFAFLTKSETVIGRVARIFIAFFGIALSIVWCFTTIRGQKMNHLWLSEAASLAKSHREVVPGELISALTATPSQSVSKTTCQLKGASSLIIPLILLFGLSWITIAVFLGSGALFC